MKITCPKCLAAYRIDLPDPGEAGIDVQCAKCLYIFLFSPDIEKPDPSEPILQPQKDEDQEVSASKEQSLQSKKQAPASPEKDQEALEELELESPSDDPEPIEIAVEDETPVDSLEEESLDDLWNQAIQEGARTKVKSKEKSPTQPSEKPVAETIDEETLEKMSPPPEKKSKPLPSLEDRQREVDQIIKDHQAKQIKSEEGFIIEESPPSLAQKNPQQEKTQEEIDLEEQVTINEKEALPSWEEAFAHQAEVEAGWNKAQKQDRAQEEQQLAEALGEKSATPEPAAGETLGVTENPQATADDIPAQVKSPARSIDQPPAQETPASFTADAGTTAEEEQEGSSEVTAASENKEATPLDPTIAGDTDLTADLNMKQLVEQAFKEEAEQTAEAPILEEVETPTLEEATPEPELTLEMETSPETPVAEQTTPVSQDIEDTDRIINYYASYVDPPATPEMEPIPEKTLESADADSTAEEEPIPEMTLESADADSTTEEEYEPIWTDAFADPLETEDTREKPKEAEEEPAPEPVATFDQEEEHEIELEPELTMESHEATVPSEEQPAMSQEPSLDEEGKELWADLLPEHKEEEPLVNEEAPIKAFDEGEEPLGGSDFWDQVLEKDSQESQTADIEANQQPVSSAPETQNTAERKALTDEELWQQAFPGEEELEPTTSQYSGEEEESSQSNIPPLVVETNVNLNEESEDPPKYDEAAYADYDDDDDDDDEFEFQRRKRNLGPFTIPHGRRGDLVIGGAMLVFLLLAGSVYFTLQTFAPGELTDIQTAKTDVPEGLSPREVPLDELAGDLMSPKPPEPEKTPPVDTPGDKGEAILSDPAKILEASPEEKGILKDLAESQILKDTGDSQTAKIDQSALQAFTGHSVTMSTIMPVAYNSTDIRVLSFSVEIQLSNAQSAKMVRESMPVYEKIMTQTVEDLLRRKFYNDILYVKEKLQKRLQTAMNKSIKNGRVRKAKFIDFAIQ